MASSLDEIQRYELLQQEMERALEIFVQVEALQEISIFFLNAWIEYVSFTCFINFKEELDARLIGEFKIWFKTYSEEGKFSEELLNRFITFLCSKSY